MVTRVLKRSKLSDVASAEALVVLEVLVLPEVGEERKQHVETLNN